MDLCSQLYDNKTLQNTEHAHMLKVVGRKTYSIDYNKKHFYSEMCFEPICIQIIAYVFNTCKLTAHDIDALIQ